VFLVDDSADYLSAASDALARDPRFSIVGAAQSGADALARIPLARPDLVLMDVEMDGFDGLAATRHLKADPGAPAVVMLSVRDACDMRRAARRVGADGYIDKVEFSPRRLRAMWQEISRAKGLWPEGH
jgi:DNA-binding NarL/FixJ family response regulator